MTSNEKLIIRLKSKLNYFTYNELVSLLTGLGYTEIKKGKSAGSRKAFINPETSHIIRLHRPHPGNILKKYQVLQVLDELEKEDLI